MLEVGKRVRIARVVVEARAYATVRAALLGMGGVIIDSLEGSPNTIFKWEVELDNGRTYFFAAIELEVLEAAKDREAAEAATRYYVIRNDGGRGRITEETRDSLLALLERGVLGGIANALRGFWVTWPGDWGDKYLVVKGEIVTPRVKETITKLEI